MSEEYRPTSHFLCQVLGESVPLEGSEFAEANLQRVIALVADPDPSNRDWATFILAYSQFDRPDVVQALIAAAADQDDRVRAEALCGLAKRSHPDTLKRVQRELAGDNVLVSFIEAAEILGDPALVPALERFASDEATEYFHDAVVAALAACKEV